MRRLLGWLGINIDAFIALLLAIVVGAAGLGGKIDADKVNAAILLTLALLAQSVLRDRWRHGTIEEETRDTLAILPERLGAIAALEKTVGRTQETLEKMRIVRVLDGAEVGKALAEARRGTDVWIFKGGTGTYTRARTLPECVANARKDKRRLTVRLEILDPTNVDLCAVYAHFRRTLDESTDATGEEWTVDRTRKEAYATVLAACWFKHRYQPLDIDVRLSQVMTTLRWDMSSERIVITQEDSRAPAIAMERGTFFYDRWSTELLASLDQGYAVPIGRAAGIDVAEVPSVEQARRVFTALELDLPMAYDDKAVREIVQKAVSPLDPYAP